MSEFVILSILKYTTESINKKALSVRYYEATNHIMCKIF